MFLLELLEGLYEIYLIFVEGPVTVWRWIRRLRQPTATELAVAQTPQMKGFRFGAWLACLGWLALSLFTGFGMQSFWGGTIVFALGFMFLPALIESRYDRLVARLSSVHDSSS
ncbi:MAG TPA: hypothetical protein VFB13_06635 [Reyranella sp.]|jgi:hypothetical protein|nr:hypothetical protein [Reyranella sp.]